MRQGNHPSLFFGSWEVSGEPSAGAVTLVSPVCDSTGLRLTRRFELVSERCPMIDSLSRDTDTPCKEATRGIYVTCLTGWECGHAYFKIWKCAGQADSSANLSVTQLMRNAGTAASLRVNHWGR
jgi:hypothetical protein